MCGHREHSPYVVFAPISIVRCQSCSFLFADAILDEQTMSSFYAESYGGLRHRQGQQVNASVNVRAVERLLQLDRGCRVLEVGSGYGFLLQALQRRFGVVPVGVELSKEEADYSRRVNGIETYETALERSGLPKGSFALVACFETIEHVPDPVRFIRSLSDYVEPGGALLIMTDNFASRAARRLGPRFPKWIPHQHVCHFTEDSLCRAIAAEPSLRIERHLSYTPWELAVRTLLPTAGRASAAPFDLRQEMATEMSRGYRAFEMRRLINRWWAALTFRPDLNGALMYALARKGAGSSQAARCA